MVSQTKDGKDAVAEGVGSMIRDDFQMTAVNDESPRISKNIILQGWLHRAFIESCCKPREPALDKTVRDSRGLDYHLEYESTHDDDL